MGRRDLIGGERGIRTPGTLPGSTVFKTAALNHSAISPFATSAGLKPRPTPGPLRGSDLQPAYVRAVITSRPSMNGRNAVGTTTEPSACW